MFNLRAAARGSRVSVRVALGVAFVGAALALSLLLRSIIEPETFFLGGVMLAAWFGGTGVGLFAALLATIAFEVLVLAPLEAPLSSAAGVARLGAFALSALLISAVSAARRNSEQRLLGLQEELEARVRDRTASLTEVNTRLQREIAERQRGEQRLSVQYAVTRLLAESASLPEAAPRLLSAIGERMGWEWGALWEVDREAGVLRCREIWHTPALRTADFDALSRETVFLPGQALPGLVWQNATPTWIVDATQQPDFLRARGALTVGLRGGFAAPIMLGHETLGVVEFFCGATREPDQEQLETLAAVGSQIGQFIERKRAQEALRESENRYRQIFETVGVSIWEEDFTRLKDAIDALQAEGVADLRAYLDAHPEFVDRAISLVEIVDVNEATLALFGAASKDELLVSLDRVFAPETRAVFAGELIAIAEGRKAFEAEAVLRTLTGEKLTLLFTITFPPPPARFDRVMVTLTDITSRKQAEEELRRQASLLEQAHDAILVWEWPGTIVYWNRGAEHLYEYSAREAIGCTSHELLRTEQRVPAEAFAAAIERDGAWTGELTHTTRGGASVVVDSRQVLMSEADGRRLVLETNRDISARKRAEDELRRSRGFLAEAQRLSHTGSFGWNPATGTISWSDETFRIFACPLDSEPSVPLVLERVHPQDRARVRQALEEARRNPRDFELEHRLLLPDGSVKHVHVVARVVTGEPPSSAVDYVGAVMDVTARTLADEALRASEEQWRAVFENNPTMYFMVGTDATILSVNPFGAQQLGYQVDELVGRSVLTIFHEDDRDGVLRNAARCVERVGEALNWEFRKIRKNGTMLWVRETARAMLIGERPVILIVCEDITERKRAESLTRQVFESSPDGVAIVGRACRYQRVNPVYERMWGMPAAQMVGMQLSELLGNDVFEEQARPMLERCFAGEEVSHAAWLRTAGGRRYAVVTYSPLHLDSDRVDAALVISRDLTEHMLASEALREAQMELARVTRVTMLGEITASIAHEVNQPLAALVMSGNACRRWLDAAPPDLDEARRAVERIISDGNRASEVIRRIRALLQRQVTEKSRLDLNEIVRDTLALTQGELARRHVAVRTELGKDLPPIVGDRVGLQQVLANLILNGMDAMAGTSESMRLLTIRSRTDQGTGVVVEVEDRGRGIDLEKPNRIFEPFFSTKVGGLGMGLSISRSIVEGHGGRLWAAPNAGAGATMCFALPVEAGVVA